MIATVRRAGARAFGPPARITGRTGVFPRVVEPQGDDELGVAEAMALGAIRSWAAQLVHAEGGAVAERYLLGELVAAAENGRPSAFVAALQEELEAIRLEGGASQETEG